MLILFLSIIGSVACIAVYFQAYRSFNTPYFLLLFASALCLAAASLCLLIPWPEADALSDLALALCGAGLAVASLQLIYSFRLAGEDLD